MRWAWRWLASTAAAPLFSNLPQRPQHLGHAPRLRYASSWIERLLGVEDFADRADAGGAELGAETVEEGQRAGVIARMHFQPRIDEGADQPAPDRALVIGGVAGAKIAVVRFLVVGIAARQ